MELLADFFYKLQSIEVPFNASNPVWILVLCWPRRPFLLLEVVLGGRRRCQRLYCQAKDAPFSPWMCSWDVILAKRFMSRTGRLTPRMRSLGCPFSTEE